MIRRIYTTCAASIILAAISPVAVCLAKPPDLPGDIIQHCPVGRDGQQAEGFDVRPEHLGPQADFVLPGRQQAQRSREGRIVHTVRTPGTIDATNGLSAREIQAHHLFDIAEHCRAVGDHAKARTCYEEVHLISPTSECGRVAIDRLRELDQARMHADESSAEEQDAPLERVLYRETTNERRGVKPPKNRRTRDADNFSDDDLRRQDMLRTTVPLGIVPTGPHS